MANVSTLSAPFVTDVGFNAPNFDLKIGTNNGASVPAGIRRLIESVEYESSDGMADMMRITFRDPQFLAPKGLTATGPIGGVGAGGGGSGIPNALRDLKVLQPGNELSISMGYGPSLSHIGRAIVRKVHPTYPRDEIPTIEVVAYTKDSAMMDNAPEKSKLVKGKGGRRFMNVRYSDAVKSRASDYGFELDVDQSSDPPHEFTQKVGLSDYDFIKGLSNICGFYFWVDGDANGVWTLHFKDPDKLTRDVVQKKEYTFKYAPGENKGSLLEFEPDLAIQGAYTKLHVAVKDPITGRLMEVEFHEDNNEAPDVLATITDKMHTHDNLLRGKHTTASDIKLFLNDFSFEVKANVRFRNEAELRAWAKQWFRRNRENFVLSNGVIVGVENVMARQTHALEGLGLGLDGKYFFNTVSHKMDNNGGYFCNIHCRKLVPGVT